MWAFVTQLSEYTRTCLDRVGNITWALNIPGFWICKGSEYARVTQGHKYATICPNNMPEYVRIYDSRHGSEYVSYST